MTEKTAGTRPAAGTGGQTAGTGAAAEFERVYRANVDAVSAYFARRTADPQAGSGPHRGHVRRGDQQLRVLRSARGTARSWVFGIARHVYASYCQEYSQQHKLRRLAGRRDLDADEVGELLERIDAERAGRDLIAGLPERDPAVIELVDIAGPRPEEARTA